MYYQNKFLIKKRTNKALTYIPKYMHTITWEPHSYDLISKHKFDVCEPTTYKRLIRPAIGSYDLNIAGVQLSSKKLLTDFHIRRYGSFKPHQGCLLRITILERIDEARSFDLLPIDQIYANTRSPLAVATSLFCSDGYYKKFLVLDDIKMFLNSSQLNDLPLTKLAGSSKYQRALDTNLKSGEIFCCVTIAPFDGKQKHVNFNITLKLTFCPQLKHELLLQPERFQLRY